MCIPFCLTPHIPPSAPAQDRRCSIQGCPVQTVSFFPFTEKWQHRFPTKLNWIRENSNTYCRRGGPSGVCHCVPWILHGVADQVGSSRAADELASRDAHLDPTSAHHAVGGDHGRHLGRTSLSIKVIPSSVLAVHLCFGVRVCCCSALVEEEEKERRRNLLINSPLHRFFF